MRECVDTVVIIMSIISGAMSLAILLTGLEDGMSADRDCKKTWARIEYVYPAYRVGCWLGERP